MTSSLSPGRWVVVGVFILAAALNYLDRQLLSAVLPTLRTEFNLDLTGLGVVSSAFYLAYALSAPLWGTLVDRWGLTQSLVSAVALWSLAGVLTGRAYSVTSLLACRALLGLAEGVVIPASGKVFATFLPPSERAFGTAANQLGITLGMFSAPLLAGVFAGSLGWRGTFVAAGLAGLIWIPIWLATHRSYRSLALPGAPKPRTASDVLRDHRLWLITLANCLVMTVYGLWSIWTTLYFVHEWRMTQTQADRVFAWIPPIFATLGGFAGGWLCYRLIARGATPATARIRSCLVGGALLLASACLPWAPSAAAGAAIISLSFFGCVFMSVNLYALPLDLFGAERAGLAIAVLTCAFGIYQTVQAPVVGKLWQSGHFTPICLFSALVPLAAAVMLRFARVDR